METVEATPCSRSYESNPKNPNPSSPSLSPPPSSSPSPSPSPSPSRLWRPAAQRNLRNQWPKLLASKDRWISAASQGRSHATALVNAYLSRKYMPDMDLGVLKDMPEIRQKACEKLSNKQMLCRNQLLLSYKDMVLAASDLIKISGSMRCFINSSTASPILQFSDHSVYKNDSGDGGGVPVFLLFSMSDFEKLAQELVKMFVLELTLKRLLVVELLSLSWEDGTNRADSLEWSEELFPGEFDELRTTGLHSEEHCLLLVQQTKDWVSRISLTELAEHSINREILQVYLTTWFANVNLNMGRIDEIFAIVEEEIQVKLL